MQLADALNTLSLRLYDWSRADFLRELETECPLLSQMGLNNRSVAGLVSWNRTLSRHERVELVQAMTKCTHVNATRLRGHAFTENDRAWHTRFYEQTTIYSYELPPLVTADESRPNFAKARPEHCLGALVECLPERMGKISRRHSAVHAKRQVGDWKLVTEFSFSRRDETLSFEFQFIRKDGKAIRSIGPGPFPKSLLMFYGIYTSTVQVPSELDSEPMAQVMVRLADYFISKSDPLFDGLSIEDERGGHDRADMERIRL